MAGELIFGNCLEVLSRMAPQSVDAVVTDPPYAQTSLAWDRWVHGWPDAIARVLKPSGSMWVFGTLRMFTDRWSEFSNWKMAQDIVWEKHNGSSLHKDRFRRVHEQAVQFYTGPWSNVYKGTVVTMDARKRSVKRKTSPAHMGKTGEHHFSSEEAGPRIMRSVIYARSQHGYAIHPTQKPEAIIEPLILNACPPDGVVIDPFAGSGTTGIVAARLKRSFVMIENNAEFYQEMRKRFDGDLFSMPGNRDHSANDPSSKP